MAVATERLADVGLPARRARSSTSRSPTRRRSARYGAQYLVDHETDAVGADYVITESGGIPIPSPDGLKLPVIVGEKGSLLVQAARAAARRATARSRTGPTTRWSPRPRSCAGSTSSSPRRRSTTCGGGSSRVDGLPGRDHRSAAVGRRARWRCSTRFPVGMARQFHACTHTTFSPNIIHGGIKINTIPDMVELEVDIRTLPGQTDDDVAGAAGRGARRPGRSGRGRAR